MELTPGDGMFRLFATERSGQWTAYAVRVDSGDRFGIETVASSEQDATRALTRWLEWQFEHTQAFEALRQAERTYHRAMGAAFASAADMSTGEGKASLDAVAAACRRLDDVRARRPDV